MSKLLISEPPLQVLPTLATRIGLNEAIFIQQLHWMAQQAHYGQMADGRKWIRNSLPDWHKTFPFFSVAALRRIIKNLQTDGLLLCRDDLNRHGYDKTGWYAVDIESLEKIDGLVERLAEINQKRKEAIDRRYEDDEGNADQVEIPVQAGTPLQNVTPLQSVAGEGTNCKGGGYKMITTIPKTSSKRSSKKVILDKDQHHHQESERENKKPKNDVDDVLPLDDEKSLHPLSAETVKLVTAVADWMGFTGDITYEMQRHGLTPAALLAWAFWVKVEGGRCRSPVGVCKSKWTGNGRRGPELPSSKWLDLARAWLELDDNGRAELLGTGGASYMLSYDFPYPDVMPAFSELYKATQGHPLPEALKPVYPEHLEEGEEQGGAVLGDEPDELEEVGTAVAIPVNGQRNPEVDELWTLLLFNETSPAFKMWLKDTKLLVDDMRAVIVVHNSYAAEWVNSLLEAINRNWKILTRHTGQEWHELIITGAVEEAHLVAA